MEMDKKPTPEKFKLLIKIVLIAGIVLLVSGFSISHGWIPQLFSLFPNFPHLLIGTLTAMFGALAIALATKLTAPQKSELFLLPVPKFKLDTTGLTALTLAIIFYLALIMDLYRKQYSHWYILLFFSALFLIGFAVYRLFPSKHSAAKSLFGKKDILVVALLMIFVIVINLIGITSWNFAYSGDEGDYWFWGSQVANGAQWNFFDLLVVYDGEPMLNSIYLGAFMKLFGNNVLASRISLIFIQAMSAALVYLLVSLFLGRFAGIVAGVILGSSHYIMAFNRTGYYNTHTLFFTLIAILMLTLALRTQKNISLYATGIAMGFCLYTSAIALPIWAIIALLLIIDFCRHRNPRQAYAWMLMFIGFLIVITPAFMATSPDEFMSKLRFNSRREANFDHPWIVGAHSLEKSVLAFWINNDGHGRYVAGPFIDIITKVLLILGIAISIFFLGIVISKIGLVWFAAGITIIAFTNPYGHASITRLHFVLPAVAILSAIAVSKLENLFRKLFGFRRKIVQGIILGLLVLVPIINIYHVQIYGPKHLAGFNHYGMVLKALQEYPEKNIVQITREPWSYAGLPGLLGWYGLSQRYTYINDTEADAFIRENLTSSQILLIYARESDIAFNLSEKLAPHYKLIIDYDLSDMPNYEPSGKPKTYLLIPEGTLKKELLTERILKIFQPIKKYEKYLITYFNWE